MTIIKKFIPFFTAFLFATSISQAMASQFEFRNIRVGGTGCPSDITQITTAPDLSSASLISSALLMA